MTLAYLLKLYAYNHWANHRALDSAAQLSVEEFIRPIGSSFSSVRDTLVHILGAEWIWLMRWKGTSPKILLDSAQFPELSDLRTGWDDFEIEQMAYLEALAEEELARLIRFTNTKGEEWEYPLGEMMYHVVNHSTYHRGQIATMLRQLGHVPEATDLLLFDDLSSAPQ
jgi:uncharacterized damage-inducible protein DinB